MDKTTIVTLTDPRSPAAEAYRALRINLAFTSLDKPLETVVISSPAPDATKSQVAVNLAVVMAQAGQRVILVDADLRRPSLHRCFDAPQEPGLTGYMLSQDGESALVLAETGVPNLHLLPSGALPPNPADILGSQKMEQLLTHLKARADVVVLDTPPVTVAVDASVLGVRTDGLLLVVQAGHTRRDHIAQAKELLERFHVRLLGAVFTDAPEGSLLTGY
ncbi:MAG TPA: CpsD/CapB family tyrosine-protein kinase [Anaerolineae bacterium]|nr:CpsD/CapB family tyrosine-protein kinase [Anaerolineae bacterium]HQK15497.1 CpsD/CapB family tyrosine-protein kinase [Anaerolineae bacterium]